MDGIIHEGDDLAPRTRTTGASCVHASDSLAPGGMI